MMCRCLTQMFTSGLWAQTSIVTCAPPSSPRTSDSVGIKKLICAATMAEPCRAPSSAPVIVHNKLQNKTLGRAFRASSERRRSLHGEQRFADDVFLV